MTNLLDITETARRLRVSKMTVYRWVAKEGLPAFRLGAVLRVDPERLQAWADKRMTTSEQD